MGATQAGGPAWIAFASGLRRVWVIHPPEQHQKMKCPDICSMRGLQAEVTSPNVDMSGPTVPPGAFNTVWFIALVASRRYFNFNRSVRVKVFEDWRPA